MFDIARIEPGVCMGYESMVCGKHGWCKNHVWCVVWCVVSVVVHGVCCGLWYVVSCGVWCGVWCVVCGVCCVWYVLSGVWCVACGVCGCEGNMECSVSMVCRGEWVV